MKTIATYDSVARTFTLWKGIWRGTFPIADVRKWLAFYRQQMQRYPAQAGNYALDVQALETLAKQLENRERGADSDVLVEQVCLNERAVCATITSSISPGLNTAG